MALGHEKLDFYRLAIGYVAWVYDGKPFDPDPDSDLDETKPQQGGGGMNQI